MQKLKIKLIIFLVFFVSAFGVSFAKATEYYVRADGTVSCADKATATSGDSVAETALNMAEFNSCTFSPGDTVWFSSRGGDFTSQVTIPSEGTASEGYIYYRGVSDAIPLIDVSADNTGFKGIYINNKSYVEVRDFDIKGSGDAGAFLIAGDSGSEGYTVKVYNVDVLSNNAVSVVSNSNDCFDLEATAQAEFYNITASGCKESAAPYTGSHQAFSAHTNAKAKVYTANFSDSNNWVANTLNTQVEIYNLTASLPIVTGVATGNDATSSYSLLIDNSDCPTCVLAVDSGKLYGGGDGSSATVTIRNSTINITASVIGYVKENFILRNNTININTTGFRLDSFVGTGLLTVNNNTINITNCSSCFSSSATGSGLQFYNNIVNGPISAGNIFRFGGGGTGDIYNNVFKNIGSVNQAVFYSDAVGSINFFNNTYYNSSSAGKAFYLGLLDGDISGTNLVIKNNIFYNIADVALKFKPTTSFSASYNDYYLSSDEGGTGSITSNPLFISAGTDFNLQSTSLAINAGTDVGLATDILGRALIGTPDMGAYEYQPPSTDGRRGIPVTFYNIPVQKSAGDASEFKETQDSDITPIVADQAVTDQKALLVEKIKQQLIVLITQLIQMLSAQIG